MTERMAVRARRAGSWMIRSRSARPWRSVGIGALESVRGRAGIAAQIDDERRQPGEQNGRAEEEIEEADPLEVPEPGRGQADADDGRGRGEDEEAGEPDLVGEEEDG